MSPATNTPRNRPCTVKEVAEMARVTPQEVRRQIDVGGLKATKFGRDWQVDRASAEAYAKRKRHPGRPPLREGGSDGNETNP